MILPAARLTKLPSYKTLSPTSRLPKTPLLNSETLSTDPAPKQNNFVPVSPHWNLKPRARNPSSHHRRHRHPVRRLLSHNHGLPNPSIPLCNDRIILSTGNNNGNRYRPPISPPIFNPNHISHRPPTQAFKFDQPLTTHTLPHRFTLPRLPISIATNSRAPPKGTMTIYPTSKSSRLMRHDSDLYFIVFSPIFMSLQLATE